jgi:hypothetical protein
MKMPYIRVGTTYYKKITKPGPDGSTTQILKRWTKDTFKDDFGKGKLKEIPIYDDFTYEPEHVNFQQKVHDCYNRYHKISTLPSPGEWPNTRLFLEHIFGDQYEVGLDYIQILFKKPLQKLPVLCLVSNERNTGKTTFILLMNAIFELNVLKISNESFSSNFNSDWNGKLIIALEEIKFEKDNLINKIKDLTTSRSFQVEKKGIDRETAPFFAKFIINSNHESDFIRLDNEDNRFWIRDIPSIKSEDSDLLKKMELEVPHFLHYLLNRRYKHHKQSRFWFSKEVTWTSALKRIRQASRPKIEFVIAHSLISALDYLDSNEIKLTVSDVSNLISGSGIRSSDSEVRDIFKNRWGFNPAKNTLIYKKTTKHPDGSFYQDDTKGIKGRYYTINRKFLEENFD